MNYEIYLDDIRKAFNYSEEEMKIIGRIFYGFQKYYCSYDKSYFNKVYFLFLTTRIVPYEIGGPEMFRERTKEKEDLMRQYSDKTEEQIENNTIFEDGELLTKIKDGTKITRTVIIKKTNGSINVSTLIHELIHGLVTQTEVKYNEEDRKIIQSGLSQRVVMTGDVTNHYIEEGFTEYDTKMICNIIGCDYVPSYSLCVEYVSAVMDNDNLKEIFLKSRVEGINYIDKYINPEFRNVLNDYVNSFDDIHDIEDVYERKNKMQEKMDNVYRISKQRKM